MNEVTQIHLGRQAFTIAADAHAALRSYLNAIEKAVGDKSVVEEVEMRMAELLAEHGVSGEKVILPEDVEFLKSQLGDPKDFSENEDDSPATTVAGSSDKRFFRDSDNAIIGGVAAGLANYLGIDVVLIRIALVVLTVLSGGSAAGIYVLLWWLVPAAETTSEKLQMRGLPVTLEALKKSVNNADIPGKAKQINSKLSGFINSCFRALLKLVGFGFILAGLGVLFAVITVKTYMLAHDGKLFQENLFPVGYHEQLLVLLGMGLAVFIAFFLVVIGITTFRRKWPLHSWVTAVLIGLFLVGSAATAALAADAVPHVQDRYAAIMHTSPSKKLAPFNKVVTKGEVDLSYIASPDYAANVHYSDNPDLSKLKLYVSNNTLYVDSTQLDTTKHCDMLCLFPRYNMRVQIYAPNIENFQTPAHTDISYPSFPALPSKI